jgi:hypothetical protein
LAAGAPAAGFAPAAGAAASGGSSGLATRSGSSTGGRSGGAGGRSRASSRGTFHRSGTGNRSSGTGSCRGGDDFLHDFRNGLDARHDRLTLRIEELDARHGLQTSDLDGLTDLEFGHIDRDGLGKILGEHAHAQNVRRHFQNAALVFHSKRFARDVDGHADLKFFVSLHLLQIDVQVFVGHGITLNFLQERKRLVGFAVAAEFDQHRATGDGFEQTGELGTFNGERLRFRVLAVENRGNAIGFAEAA